MDVLPMLTAAYDAWNRHDADALVALADPEIEIHPLVSAVTSVGPWQGHDGVRRLVTDAQERWAVMHMRFDDFVEIGDRIVVLVHIETRVNENAPLVTGEAAHLLHLKNGLITHYAGYRDRQEALAAAAA